MVKVYTNPSSKLIYLHSGDNEKIEWVKLISSNGQVVFEEITSSFNVSINTQNLKSGNYIILIKRADHIYERKIALL